MGNKKLLSLIFFILIVISCTNKNDLKNNVSKNSEAASEKISDEILKQEYEKEVLFANLVISKLEDYYTQNGFYPDFSFDLEQDILNQTPEGYYYFKIPDSPYRLIFQLTDGTGLLYISETKSWTTGKHLP